MKLSRVIETDVLVVGGGGAACRAAIGAYDVGAVTILALKGRLGASGATVAPGLAVAWQASDDCAGPEDSPEVHLNDILEAGLGMADPRLARILAYEVVERMQELEHWGLRFAPDPEGNKRHFTAYSCFGTQPRAHTILNSGHGHAGDIVVVLRRQLERRHIPVHEHTFVIDLLVDGNRCVGALALDPDGRLIVYRAGAVVLGTGGARQIYPPAGAHRIDTTGDGYAMALRAGAELTNMEYVQFMLGMLPSEHRLQVPGDFWALYPQVRNRLGQDVLADYLPPGVTRQEAMWARTLHAPFSCRDASGWLDIAIFTEVREGRGTPQGALWVDFSQVDLGAFRPSRPMHRPQDYTMPVILPAGWLEVRSTAHAINGGVRIDPQGRTSLPGLYAAGETAAGPHGADRLGGGMVTNCQVFGARAGAFAARFALQSGPRELSAAALDGPLARLGRYGQGQGSSEEVLASLQRIAGRHLMVVRNRAGLQHLIAQIERLQRVELPRCDVSAPDELRRALEVENSLLTAELMARAALMRQESRGSHFREDYPARDDVRWRVNILFRQIAGKLRQTTGGPQLE
ncbi:MAG: FAD-binding protein, partial [Anaerolineae bacterium]|nr:FAD-binding protein [Anaerolineae bacterium]